MSNWRIRENKLYLDTEYKQPDVKTLTSDVTFSWKARKNNFILLDDLSG